MPLISEIVGALCAGALVVLVARQLGLESRRAFGAVALVTIAVATVLALPNLRDSVSALLSQRKEYVGLSKAEAQVEQGTKFNVNVNFLAWVKEHLGEGETFKLEIGTVPGEPTFEGGGVFQGTIYAWSSYQLGPNLLTEDAPTADWIVFYSMNPDEYPGQLGEVLTYEPNYAMARTDGAG